MLNGFIVVGLYAKVNGISSESVGAEGVFVALNFIYIKHVFYYVVGIILVIIAYNHGKSISKFFSFQVDVLELYLLEKKMKIYFSILYIFSVLCYYVLCKISVNY